MANIDKKIEKAIEPIVKMYSELETELMVELARHFELNGEFINSDYWRIQKLDEMGAFNSKVIDYISRYTNKSPSKIKKALKQIYNDTLDIDTLRSAFKDGKILINPNEIMNNTTLKAIMQYAYDEEIKRFIKMSKLIETATRQKYLDIIEKGYLATSAGIKSYSESIRESLNELANKGIGVLDYTYKRDDGSSYIRSYDIEGTVRREILTGARQLSGNLNNELIDLTNCEYVKFSEHLDCRPEHFDWQGTIVKTEEWKKISEYGEITGIYGINCRHYAEPYFGNNRGSEEKEYSKKEVDNAYKISQKQRYLERGIRAWKRRQEIAKASNDSEMLNKSKTKVKEWSNKLDKFTEENNRRRDFTREYVANIKKSLPVEIDNDYIDVTNNWLDNATPNSHKVIIDDYFVDDTGIKHPIVGKEMAHLTPKDSIEYNKSKWIEETFGREMHNVPRITDITNTGLKTSTPDYVWNNEKWDLKTPGTDGKFENTLERFVKKKSAKLQARKFIIDYVNFPEKTDEEILKVINDTLSSPSRKWIEDLLIIRGDKIVKIYSKAK